MHSMKKQKSDVIFVLIVFCVFVISILIVLGLSGIAYKNIVSLTQKNYDEQIGLSFIWTKVKHGDEMNKVIISEFQGLPALSIESEFDDITFYTMIYFYDEWIREMFFEEGYELSADAGFPIVRAESFNLEQMDLGLIRVSIDAGSLYISPRGKSN